MKNKKLNLVQISKRADLLTKEQQKALKGGSKFVASSHLQIPNKQDWIEVDIRIANPGEEIAINGNPMRFVKKG